MRNPLLRSSLLIILLILLLPAQALAQEAIRLFDLEVDENFSLSDPGELVPPTVWYMGGMSFGLFDQSSAFAGLRYPQLLVVEGNDLFLVDSVDGSRVLVLSLPNSDLTHSSGEDGIMPGEFVLRTGHRIGLDVIADTFVLGPTSEFVIDLFDSNGNVLGSALLPGRRSPADTGYRASIPPVRWYQIAVNAETGKWELIELEIPS